MDGCGRLHLGTWGDAQVNSKISIYLFANKLLKILKSSRANLSIEESMALPCLTPCTCVSFWLFLSLRLRRYFTVASFGPEVGRLWTVFFFDPDGVFKANKPSEHIESIDVFRTVHWYVWDYVFCMEITSGKKNLAKLRLSKTCLVVKSLKCAQEIKKNHLESFYPDRAIVSIWPMPFCHFEIISGLTIANSSVVFYHTIYVLKSIFF